MSEEQDFENKVAPEGKVYVCCAYGKRSRDFYGYQPIDRGWDESCVLNCVLASESQLVMNPAGTRVIQIVEDPAALPQPSEGA